MTGRRFRPPSPDRLVILLSGIVGAIAVGGIVAAVFFALKVHDLSNRQQEGRRAAIEAVCVTDSEQNRVLRGLIVSGVKGSRPFERLYREFGAPPYRERLRAARLAARSLPPVDCLALQRRARTLP